MEQKFNLCYTYLYREKIYIYILYMEQIIIIITCYGILHDF